MGSGEGSLGLFALSSESSERSVVGGDVDLGLLLEFGHAEVDESVIEIFTTEMGVSVGSLDLEDTVLNGEEGDIEGTTTEIEDEHVSFLGVLFVETVGDSSGGGLVDDSLDGESGNGSGILGGLSLGIVEVGGDGDNGVGDGLTHVSLSDFLHLDEDHGGDLISLDVLVTEFTANESLGVEDSVGGVSGNLGLGGVSDESLLFGEGNVGGGGVESLVVSDNLNFIVLPDSDTGVSSSKINSDS